MTVVNPRHSRPPDPDVVAGLERALAAERQGRDVAEKALKQARDTIQQLQTRLAHAEIARREAASPVVEPASPPVPIPPALTQPALAQPAPDQPKAPRRRSAEPAGQNGGQDGDDQAVDWWTPGWRERFRARQQDAGTNDPDGDPPQP